MKGNDCDESLLLNKLSESDYSAFSMLYEMHVDALYSYAKRIQMDMEDAEDAIQDIFASLWIRREKIQILDLKLWLYNALRRQMLYRLRKRKYQNQFEQHLSLIFNENSYDANIISHISYKELLAEINQQLNTLSPQKKKIFILSRFDRKSHKEIASDLDISELTVKKHINTVLKVLRKKIGYKTFFTFLYSLIIFCATS